MVLSSRGERCKRNQCGFCCFPSNRRGSVCVWENSQLCPGLGSCPQGPVPLSCPPTQVFNCSPGTCPSHRRPGNLSMICTGDCHSVGRLGFCSASIHTAALWLQWCFHCRKQAVALSTEHPPPTWCCLKLPLLVYRWRLGFILIFWFLMNLWMCLVFFLRLTWRFSLNVGTQKYIQTFVNCTT